MEKKIAKFEGGPLDGDSIELNSNVTEYKSLELLTNPPYSTLERQEVLYEENPVGSGNFVQKDQQTT